MGAKIIFVLISIILTVAFNIVPFCYKNTTTPINFFTGDSGRLKGIVKDVKNYNIEMARVFKYYSLIYLSFGIVSLFNTMLVTVILLLNMSVGLYIVYNQYKNILQKYSKEDLMMATPAAFFDIDGTLYREGLITEVFKKFVSHELVDESKWHDEVKPAFMKYDRRQGEYDDYLLKMTDIYTNTLIGLSNEHILHIANKVINQKGERVYTFTRDEILRHKQEGHYVFAVSGSPLELVNAMARKYNFTDCRGTIYQVDETNHYTGEVIPMWDHASKQKAIYELVEKYDIDLSESYAYGDTTGDFTMFELVGHPYAINPTKELLQKIMDNPHVKEKIHIIVERKNVVYEMKLDNIKIK